MKNVSKLLVASVLGITVSGLVYAATQSFSSPVRFVRPISFANAVNPNLGDWYTGASGRNIGITDAGVATGTDVADYVSGATAGSVDILGSPSRTISIVANNFQNNGGGVDIATVPCSWNGGAATSCNGAGITGASTTVAGRTLALGVTANTNAVSTDGQVANPSFDIVVNYE